jgi:hypothetical protein
LVVATCARGTPTPGNWYYDSQTKSCFFLSSEEEGWNDAQAKCLNMSTNLASIALFEHVFITTLLSEQFAKDSQVYIGLHLAQNLAKEHEWVDGSSSTLRVWDKDQPDPTKMEACVTMNSRNGKWMDEDCSKKYRYLCMAGSADKGLQKRIAETTFNSVNGNTLIGVGLAIFVIVPALTYLAFFFWKRRAGGSGPGPKSQRWRVQTDEEPVLDTEQDTSYT